MEFNWSTFILEAVNFVVLVWILKRLLYRPIMNAVKERKNKIEGTLQKAENLHQEALELQEKYQNRLRDWEKEKEEKRSEFKKEMDEEKLRSVKLLEQDLEKRKEKRRAQEEQRMAEQQRKSEAEAIKLAAQFSSRVWKKLAGPETEKNIIGMFIEDIKKLPEEKARQLKNGFLGDKEAVVEIKTAFPLEERLKLKLQDSLRPLFRKEVGFEFHQAPELVAGLSVSLGPLILEANLRDELSYFTQVAQHGE